MATGDTTEYGTLKFAYVNTLHIVDNLRLLAHSLSERGIDLDELGNGALSAAFEGLADVQEAIEAIVPKQDLF